MNLSKVFISVSYSFSLIHSCFEHMTGGVNRYLHLYQSSDPCVSCALVFVCVISDQSTSKNHVICVKSSVKLMPCWIQCFYRDVLRTNCCSMQKFHEEILWSKKILIHQYQKSRTIGLGGKYKFK